MEAQHWHFVVVPAGQLNTTVVAAVVAGESQLEPAWQHWAAGQLAAAAVGNAAELVAVGRLLSV